MSPYIITRPQWVNQNFGEHWLYMGLAHGDININSISVWWSAFPSKAWDNVQLDLFNSSPPSATYMCQWTWSSLNHITACRLFGAKPLPEPMLVYCRLDSWEQISVKFELKFCHFHSRMCIWNCRLPKWWPFRPGGDELMGSITLDDMLDEYHRIPILTHVITTHMRKILPSDTLTHFLSIDYLELYEPWPCYHFLEKSECAIKDSIWDWHV